MQAANASKIPPKNLFRQHEETKGQSEASCSRRRTLGAMPSIWRTAVSSSGVRSFSHCRQAIQGQSMKGRGVTISAQRQTAWQGMANGSLLRSLRLSSQGGTRAHQDPMLGEQSGTWEAWEGLLAWIKQAGLAGRAACNGTGNMWWQAVCGLRHAAAVFKREQEQAIHCDTLRYAAICCGGLCS